MRNQGQFFTILSYEGKSVQIKFLGRLGFLSGLLSVMKVHLNVYSWVPTLCIKSQGRDFPPVHGEVMYYFQLPRECRDFAELCVGEAAYPPIQVASNACNIVHRPLWREFDAAISTMFHVDEPERASMNIDAGEKVFSQLGRILQELRQLW